MPALVRVDSTIEQQDVVAAVRVELEQLKELQQSLIADREFGYSEHQPAVDYMADFQYDNEFNKIQQQAT